MQVCQTIWVQMTEKKTAESVRRHSVNHTFKISNCRKAHERKYCRRKRALEREIGTKPVGKHKKQQANSLCPEDT